MSTATATAAKLIDPAAIAESLELLIAPGDVVEVRALNATTHIDNWRPATWSGYFDDPAKLVEALEGLASASGVYITPNPVNPALLARAANRLKKSEKGGTTGDNDILRRRWLLIDADAVRPSGIASSDSEHAAALERVEQIELYLHNLGFPDPIRADSGNGGHLLFHVDLPADEDGMVQRILERLAAAFDDDAVKVDTSVFNPARIWRLYGCLNCKGDSTAERPHRMAKIIASPDALKAVPLRLLEELAGPAPSAAPHHERKGHAAGNGQAFDLAGFIARNLDADGPFPWVGGQKWTLRTSPLCEHHDDGPHIEQHASGAISAGCHHDSCVGKWGWAEVRAKYEPKPEWKYDGGDKWTRADAPEGQTTSKRKIIYKRITSLELAGGKYEVEYLIDDSLVARQPLIIAGPQKTLKTSFIIDAAVTLAAGGCFLGKLRASRACRVAVMTGESGLGAIQETAQRICVAAGKHLCDLSNLFWTPDLPKFGNPAHLKALEEFVTADAIEVLFIDPAYLAMPGADAGNLMVQGELLRSVSELCQRLGVTLVLAHHTKKSTGRDPFDVPELSDIAWSGFAEFARQWWLLGRREKYEPGTGSHKLWLSIGGSAGHSALWAVDVEEGLRTDPDGRRWEVSLKAPREARATEGDRKIRQREQRAAELLEVNKAAACRVLAKHPAGMTKTAIRDAAGIGKAFEQVLAALIEAGDVVLCEVTTGNQKTPKPGYRLAQDVAP